MRQVHHGSRDPALDRTNSGDVYFEQVPVFKASKSEMRGLRQQMQVIFQDPYSSLNPRLTVEQIVSEGIVIHKARTPQERREQVADLLNRVGLRPGRCIGTRTSSAAVNGSASASRAPWL